MDDCDILCFFTVSVNVILEEHCCGATIGVLLVKLVFFCSAG